MSGAALCPRLELNIAVSNIPKKTQIVEIIFSALLTGADANNRLASTTRRFIFIFYRIRMAGGLTCVKWVYNNQNQPTCLLLLLALMHSLAKAFSEMG
ncbi:MAG: hypothetical protein AAB134_00985 [Pseudomonadota bacterium]